MKCYKDEICKYIDTIWELMEAEIVTFIDKMYSSKKLCIFGAGAVGKSIANDLIEMGVNIDFFCDNNEKLCGKDICYEIKCISIQELEKYKKDVTVVIATGYYKEISKQLKCLGINDIYISLLRTIRIKKYIYKQDHELFKDKVCKVLDILEDYKSKDVFTKIIINRLNSLREYPNYNEIMSSDQYFEDDVINLSDEEIFVDIGAFDGDTIYSFLDKKYSHFNKIFAYELDKANFKELKTNVDKMDDSIKDKVYLYNLGVYDQNGVIKYNSNSTGSMISSSANLVGEVVKLSDHLKSEEVTYIKMDIEGGEVKALYGAENIIKKYKPKLAICVYHEPEHLLDIPIYIKSLVPTYKIYLRHYIDREDETVCYAIR